MSKYICEKCSKEFKQKSHYTTHINKKIPCVNEFKIVEKKNVKDVRDEGLDKFYTLPIYSKKCIDKVFELYDKLSFDLIIEPSAGNGSFFNQLDCDNKIGIDISPEDKNIIKMDFFNYTPQPHINNILVIGNTPFVKVSSISIKFFNHSAKWANVIAFIIPRTFRRPSVQNKLNNMFHLIYDEDVASKGQDPQPVELHSIVVKVDDSDDEVQDVETIGRATGNLSG